jgi:signal peptidase I
MSDEQFQNREAGALPESAVDADCAAEVAPSADIVPIEAAAELQAKPVGSQRQACAPVSSEPGVAPGRGPYRRLSPGPWGSLQSLAATVVIAIFVITFIVQAFQIPSESMENTLLIGDYLLVDKVHFSPGGHWSEMLPYEPVKRGEIIVFRYPVNPSQHFVKRVVAIPGDRVRLYNKRAWVNGKPLDESHTVFHSEYRDSYRDNFPSGDLPSHIDPRWWQQMQTLTQGGELLVPPGEYFVLGDNRDESLDSRYWGFVPRQNIVGRPLIVYFSWEADHGPFPRAEAASDKLTRFAEAFTSVVREIRWGRTMHLVQ